MVTNCQVLKGANEQKGYRVEVCGMKRPNRRKDFKHMQKKEGRCNEDNRMTGHTKEYKQM